MEGKGKIALIYFSRSVKSEAKNKSWTTYSTKAQRESISRFLSDHTHKVLRKSGLDILHFDEDSQVGTTFGEKITNAFATTFSLGYTQAISVGNDCLDLDQSDFSTVTRILQEGKCVLGPTFRNGAYLIGLTAAAFDAEKFSTLRWQSEDLEDDLKDYFLGQCCGIAVLERLRDINHLRDFKRILSTVTLASVVRKLMLFLRSFSLSPITFVGRSYSFSSLITPVLRGPPAFA